MIADLDDEDEVCVPIYIETSTGDTRVFTSVGSMETVSVEFYNQIGVFVESEEPGSQMILVIE